MTDKVWRSMDYLVHIGFKKAGRGRPPKGCDERLAQAVSEGIKFNDWPKENRTIKVPARRVTVTAPTKVVPQITTRPVLWDDGITFKGANGKMSGPNEACGNCGWSLAYCFCRFPHALAGNESCTITRYRGKSEIFPPMVDRTRAMV